MVNTSTPQYRGMFDQLPINNVNQFETTILDDIVQQLHRFIVLPHAHDYTAIALYCAYTYVSGEFDFAPRLMLTSAEKRSGKTRTLEVIQTLVHSPQMTANISPSALYRVIQSRPGVTILFDEVDTVFNAKMANERSEELRGLLNAGFQKNGTVTRVNLSATDGLEEFSVFAPVVIAAIGNLPDTIADRSIPIRLRRRRYDETVEQFRLSVEAKELEQLGVRLGEQMEQYAGELVGAQPDTPLTDRAADVWTPLIAVADLFGQKWADKARQAAVHITKRAQEISSDNESDGIKLLEDVRNLTEWQQSDFISSTKLQQLLISKEDGLWREVGLSTRKLATLLKPYGVNPTRSKDGNQRGYKRIDLEDVFARYLTPPMHEDNRV